MIKGILGGIFMLAAGAAHAAPAISGIVLCTVGDSGIPNPMNFKEGERFLIAYQTDSEATLRWIFADGSGREVQCSNTGDMMACAWPNKSTIIFNRKDLTIAMPTMFGPTMQSWCKPLDIKKLP